MGIKYFTTYVNKNIELIPQEWTVNKKFFYELRSLCSSNIKQFNPINNNKEDNLNLIIDGKSFFYSFGYKLNWFVYDNLCLLRLLRKVINLIRVF